MIGLCAQSRMGKDTVADYIMNVTEDLKSVKSGKSWKKKAFSEELKKVLSLSFNISLSEIEQYKVSSDVHPNLKVTVRKALQMIGETFRHVSPDVWVENAFKSVESVESIGPTDALTTKGAYDLDKNSFPTQIVFTDVRHENEMDSIIARDGVLILIGRTASLNVDPHPSESTFLNAIKWFLENTEELCVKTASYEKKCIPLEYKNFSYFLRNDASLEELYASIDWVLVDAKIVV